MIYLLILVLKPSQRAHTPIRYPQLRKKMRIIFIILAIGLISCQNKTEVKITEKKTNSELKSVDLKKVDLINDVSNSKDFSSISKSKYLLSENSVSLLTLKDFKKNGDLRSTKNNDSLFMEFLINFTSYQNILNDSLYRDPNYETYNTLIYSDETLIDPKAKVLESIINEYGFFISSSEGAIFFEKNPSFLNNFTIYLSETMNVFKKQYIKEIKFPILADGAIIISTKELIDRMLFWEKFASSNKNFELTEYAQVEFEMNLFYLMFGIDNTPIFDWNSQPYTIKSELIKAFERVIEEHPESKSVKYLEDYLVFIEDKKFIYNKEFDEYARMKFPKKFEN